MLGEARDEVAPFSPVFGRRNNRVIPERMQYRLGGKLLRHEAEFHKGVDPALYQSVVNLIDIRKVVNRSAVGVFAVDADLIMKNRVEADIFEPSNLFNVVQITAITFAQAQDRAPGSEHALPEMWEGMGSSGEIDVDHLCRRLNLGRRGLRDK